VLGRQELFSEDGGEIPPAFSPPMLPERHPELVDRGSLQPLSLMVRRVVWDGVGEFETEFDVGEDIDWLARLWETEHRVEVLDAVVVRRRVHDRNLTHQAQAARLAMFRVLKTHAARVRGENADSE
jgi:hypothetical protein